MSAEEMRVLLNVPLNLWAIRREGSHKNEYVLSEAGEVMNVSPGVTDERSPVRLIEKVGKVTAVVTSRRGSVLSIPIERVYSRG